MASNNQSHQSEQLDEQVSQNLSAAPFNQIKQEGNKPETLPLNLSLNIKQNTLDDKKKDYSYRRSSNIKRTFGHESETFRKPDVAVNLDKEENEWWSPRARVVIVPPHKVVEEYEKNMCEKTYPDRVKRALKNRKKWTKLAKSFSGVQNIETEKGINSYGPGWFQDLSIKQMEIMEELNKTLEFDTAEGNFKGTYLKLITYGVHPPVPLKEVKRCMKECMDNTIRFLFLIHRFVADREQQSYDTKYKNSQETGAPLQKYSINERLLLSGVFHLHFKEFTRKLDKVLPPVPETPKIILPSNKVPQPKIKYPSPYLEPLPITPKVWYEQKLEDEMYAEHARLKALQDKKEFKKNVLKEAEEQKKIREEKLKILLERKNYASSSKELKKSSLNDVLQSRENKSEIFRRISSGKGIERKSVQNSLKGSSSDLLSTNTSKSKKSMGISDSFRHMRKTRRYMYDLVHENVQTKASFGGFFANDNKLMKDTEGAFLKVRLVPKNERVTCLYKDEDFKPLQILDTRVRVCCRDVGTQTNPEPMFLPLDVSTFEVFYQLMNNISSVIDASTNTDQIDHDEEKGLEKAKKESSPSRKHINVECPDENCGIIENSSATFDEYQMLRKKIEFYSPPKQLKAAVAFLCRKGDPMAVLPKVEDTPWIQRWFERRRGIKLKLTEADKNALMKLSEDMWKGGYNSVKNEQVKKLKISGTFTVMQKEWLDKQINIYKDELHTRLRQKLVNNARDYFPSFFVEYMDYPANKNMRNIFYTYLPSKELDSFVFRVWNGECKQMVKEI